MVWSWSWKWERQVEFYSSGSSKRSLIVTIKMMGWVESCYREKINRIVGD